MISRSAILILVMISCSAAIRGVVDIDIQTPDGTYNNITLSVTYNVTTKDGSTVRDCTITFLAKPPPIKDANGDEDERTRAPTQAPTAGRRQERAVGDPATFTTYQCTTAGCTSYPVLAANDSSLSTVVPVSTLAAAPTTQGPPTTAGPTAVPVSTVAAAPTTQGPPTTAAPSVAPTPGPTKAPTTPGPTKAPTTPEPTKAPTTKAPTAPPTTRAPTTAGPTRAPTVTGPILEYNVTINSCIANESDPCEATQVDRLLERNETLRLHFPSGAHIDLALLGNSTRVPFLPTMIRKPHKSGTYLKTSCTTRA